MELVEITPDWGVELQSPECDLGGRNCTKIATYGLRVHGCAFHFVCDNCRNGFEQRMRINGAVFQEMRCRVCKVGFSTEGFYEIVEL